MDEKIGLVLSAVRQTGNAREARQAGTGNRLLSAAPHQRTSAGKTQRLLGQARETSYGAIREDVARHPNADATTLTYLSRDRSQPLWYLVAFNPNTPTPLQRRLRDRLEATRRKITRVK